MNVTILGAGKVGRGLSRGLASTPHRVQLIALGRGVRAPIRDALLVLAVRDGDLQRVARELAPWVSRRTAVVHVAGAMGTEVLAPLRRCAAGVGQAHPMLSFASRKTSPSFAGALLLVSGDEVAVRRASTLGRALGMRPQRWRVKRALYHAAGGIVANGGVALAAAGAELLAAAGVPRDEAARVLAPLLRSVADNLEVVGLPEALSGPIRRGDAATVARHLAALQKSAPALLGLYCESAKLQLILAKALGDAAPEALRSVAAVLDSGGASNPGVSFPTRKSRKPQKK
ncbi:MAG: DUF2520 domain-containing protein [Myxococcales bacterium]|nr:DUF2520 domain-containing protein [Myxococcales bacterium]MCB9582964.1 DUF2520 domain-containing protein [Polyangiaceae bacterium]